MRDGRSPREISSRETSMFQPREEQAAPSKDQADTTVLDIHRAISISEISRTVMMKGRHTQYLSISCKEPGPLPAVPSKAPS